MSTIPNPDTYLNHLTPTEATQFEIARDLCLTVLGAAIWDILVYIPDDIKIVRHSPMYLVTFCFVFSRVFAVTFVLLGVVEQTGPIEECTSMFISIGVFCVLAMGCTSFLFLQRVRAVYMHNMWAQGIFVVLWLGSCAAMSTTAFGGKSAHVPGTKYCVYSQVNRYMAAAGFMTLFFDTSVFLAISYKVATAHSNLDAGISWDTIISGRALPRVSRALLQGGQQYYLIVVCLNIPVGVLIALPSISPIFKLMLGFPLVSLAASMACRVFRNLKMSHFHEETQTLISHVDFATRSCTVESSVNPSGGNTSSSTAYFRTERPVTGTFLETKDNVAG